MTADDQDRRLDKIEAELAAIKTSTAYGFGQISEQIGSLRDSIQILATRPPMLLPDWFVLAIAVSSIALSVATLALVVYLVLR